MPGVAMPGGAYRRDGGFAKRRWGETAYRRGGVEKSKRRPQTTNDYWSSDVCRRCCEYACAPSLFRSVAVSPIRAKTAPLDLLYPHASFAVFAAPVAQLDRVYDFGS
jgi:hypothetical protein